MNHSMNLLESGSHMLSNSFDTQPPPNHRKNRFSIAHSGSRSQEAEEVKEGERKSENEPMEDMRSEVDIACSNHIKFI